MTGQLNRAQVRFVRFQLQRYGLRLPPVGGMVEVPAYGRRRARIVGHDRRGYFIVGGEAKEIARMARSSPETGSAKP